MHPSSERRPDDRDATPQAVRPPVARQDEQEALPPDAPATLPLPASSLLAGPGAPGRGYASARSAMLLPLQQRHGNRAVQRLLARSSAFAVSQPTDASELEADRLANQAVGQAPAGEARLDSGTAGAGAAPGNGQETLPAGAEAAVQAASGSSGLPLPAALRRQLEPRLGSSLDGVRVHTDAASNAAAAAIDAQAYTVGGDIHFADGKYDPHTEAGQKLIAHEAVHTIQQGATTAGAVIQRDPNDNSWMDNFPTDRLPKLPGGWSFPAFPEKPKEVNWEAPATAVEDLTPNWGEWPNFPSGYEAHEKTRELDEGKVRFQNDWATLKQSYNSTASLAAKFNIKAKLPEAHVSEINGQPVAPPKSLVPESAENARPSGKQDFSVGSIFNDQNSLDMKKPFDPGSLKGADRDTYDKKMAETVTARNAREKAGIEIDNKMVTVKNSLSKVRQAQIKEKQAQKAEDIKGKETAKTLVAQDKAEIETILKGAEAVFTAGVKKDPAAAAFATAGTITSLYYDEKIGKIDTQIKLLEGTIANLQTSYEMESVVQAKNDVVTALNGVKTASIDLNTALQAEKTAFNNLALTIEEMAKKLGLDPESAKIARTAASALPLIEETIGQLSQIEAVLQIPAYSPTSGIGAALVTNLDTFKSHLGQLKGYKPQVDLAKQKWIARRSAAQQGIGMPAQTPPP